MAYKREMMKSKVFHGSPEEVQQQLSDFLEGKTIKVQGFAQSQSTCEDNKEARYVVTATILYTEFEKEPKSVMGFNRE